MRAVVLAVLLAGPVAAADPAEPSALEARESSCAGDDWQACENLGSVIGREPATTRARYAAACKRGDAASCAFLGDWIFEHGVGSEGRIDPRSSVAWYRKSCRAKSSYGCARLAWMLPETREALAIHERLCTARWGPSCRTFGAHLDGFSAKPAQRRRAFAAYTRGCDANDVASCWRAGFVLADLPDATDQEREAAWAKMDTACRAGDAANCRVLRDIFACGQGTACDAARAEPYRRRAFELDPNDGYYTNKPAAGGPAPCTCKKP